MGCDDMAISTDIQIAAGLLIIHCISDLGVEGSLPWNIQRGARRPPEGAGNADTRLVAGLSVGFIVVVFVVIGLVYFCWYRRTGCRKCPLCRSSDQKPVTNPGATHAVTSNDCSLRLGVTPHYHNETKQSEHDIKRWTSNTDPRDKPDYNNVGRRLDVKHLTDVTSHSLDETKRSEDDMTYSTSTTGRRVKPVYNNIGRRLDIKRHPNEESSYSVNETMREPDLDASEITKGGGHNYGVRCAPDIKRHQNKETNINPIPNKTAESANGSGRFVGNRVNSANEPEHAAPLSTDIW